MASESAFILWDCSTSQKNPVSTWKKAVGVLGGKRPSGILILMPPETTIPDPVSKSSGLSIARVFTGENCSDLCFLEMAVLMATNKSPHFVVVSDDVERFATVARVSETANITLITNQALEWPLSSAQWAERVSIMN